MRIESGWVGLGYYQFDWDSSVFMIEFHRNDACTSSIVEITEGEVATVNYLRHSVFFLC
jgi:hypothetical protein